MAQNTRTFTTVSAEETRALAGRFSQCLRPGDVVLLDGPMGAGKSEFARGLAAGLGIQGPVPSPSFTIMNLYQEGTLPLCHFDWYRIQDGSELTDIGLDEYIGFEGVCVIEWFQRAPELLPDTVMEVRLVPVDEQTRQIHFTPKGRWEVLHP